MRTLSPRTVSLLFALATMLGGCLPVIEVRTRTRILPDGATIRETRLVKIRRGHNSEQEKLWNERPIAEDLGKRLGEGFGAVERTDDEIVLSGVFTHPSRIPSDFQRDVDLIDGTSRNMVRFKTEDILFGTRYLYREHYVDAIEPKDEGDARRELIRFVTRFLRSTVHHEFGEAYDYTRFDAWVDEEVAQLFDQLIDIYWIERRKLGQEDPLTGKTGFDRALRLALSRLAAFGLALDPDGSNDENIAVFREWLTAQLAERLLPSDPRSRSLTPADFLYLVPEERPAAALMLPLERAAERDFGSVDEAKREFQRRLLGLTGTYGSPPAEAEFRFDCAVEMPGMLLTTNGFLESDRSAFWLFEGQDLFPRGFVCEAESVALDGRRLGRIRELKTTLTRRDAVRLIRRLKDTSAAEREQMGQLLDEFARHGTLAVALEGEDEEHSRIRKKLESILEVVLKER